MRIGPNLYGLSAEQFTARRKFKGNGLVGFANSTCFMLEVSL